MQELMITESICLRLDPTLKTLVEREVRVKNHRDRTEVIERALCQYFGLEYKQTKTKQPKSRELKIREVEA